MRAQEVSRQIRLAHGLMQNYNDGKYPDAFRQIVKITTFRRTQKNESSKQSIWFRLLLVSTLCLHVIS